MRGRFSFGSLLPSNVSAMPFIHCLPKACGEPSSRMARTYCAADNEPTVAERCLCRPDYRVDSMLFLLMFVLMFVRMVFFHLHSRDGTRELPCGFEESRHFQRVRQDWV